MKKEEPKMRNLEREMQSQLIDCSLDQFVRTMRLADVEELEGMRNILRVDYQAVEFAWKDLSDKIQERENKGELYYHEEVGGEFHYTEEEKDLFLNLSLTMFTIEERCRILTEEIDKERVKQVM
mgnify:CR=1 FL=1